MILLLDIVQTICSVEPEKFSTKGLRKNHEKQNRQNNQDSNIHNCYIPGHVLGFLKTILRSLALTIFCDCSSCVFSAYLP